MKLLRFLRALTTDRRVIFGLGALLLVGGWGTMQYVHESQVWWGSPGVPLHRWYGTEQVAEAMQPNPPIKVWYSVGVAMMAVGGGLMGFAALGKGKRSDK